MSVQKCDEESIHRCDDKCIQLYRDVATNFTGVYRQKVGSSKVLEWSEEVCQHTREHGVPDSDDVLKAYSTIKKNMGLYCSGDTVHERDDCNKLSLLVFKEEMEY
jgi:hypothetical protein